MAVGRGSGRGLRSLRAAIFGAVVVLTMVEPCAGQQNVMAPGGVAVGRDIKDSTINFGLTPEQVKELTEAAVRGATGPLTSTIVDLGKRLNHRGCDQDASAHCWRAGCTARAALGDAESR